MGFVLILNGISLLSRGSCWFRLMFTLIGFLLFFQRFTFCLIRVRLVSINLSRIPLQFNRIPIYPINSTKIFSLIVRGLHLVLRLLPVDFAAPINLK